MRTETVLVLGPQSAYKYKHFIKQRNGAVGFVKRISCGNSGLTKLGTVLRISSRPPTYTTVINATLSDRAEVVDGHIGPVRSIDGAK